jgi:hypothetical protein
MKKSNGSQKTKTKKERNNRAKKGRHSNEPIERLPSLVLLTFIPRCSETAEDVKKLPHGEIRDQRR